MTWTPEGFVPYGTFTEPPGTDPLALDPGPVPPSKTPDGISISFGALRPCTRWRRLTRRGHEYIDRPFVVIYRQRNSHPPSGWRTLTKKFTGERCRHCKNGRGAARIETHVPLGLIDGVRIRDAGCIDD